ncbi:disulfide bond formation protein B [Ferribacterium limneticum]|uniref:disulfide bond formation protein B n=1 Tax=Ferribacterium limneticum TaxID=76259 RepID=UPI001CF8AE9A|nr:disulfide bond formation protein B [Ferribacterium limneticum]UCV21896.1 disulfide bond formation protein B [Ferribacterium limneticum]
MNWLKVPTRAWFATLGLGCLGLVAVGMELQTLLRLAPCPLCIFQRLLYIVIGIVGLLGFIWPAGRMLWVALAGALAVLGFGVASYQTWMQAFPHLAPECSFTDPNIIERLVDWLGMEWPSMFLATGFCTSRDWEFLGLSMANWSVLVFAGIVVYAALLFRQKQPA